MPRNAASCGRNCFVAARKMQNIPDPSRQRAPRVRKWRASASSGAKNERSSCDVFISNPQDDRPHACGGKIRVQAACEPRPVVMRNGGIQVVLEVIEMVHGNEGGNLSA